MRQVVNQASPLSTPAAQLQLVKPNSADLGPELVSVIDFTISYLDHAFPQTVDKFAITGFPIMIVGDKMTIDLIHPTSQRCH